MSLDTFRGLIMVLMALDHASYFIARVHRAEFWSRDLPRYRDALPFLTRFVTHFCAPGFFLLMGAGLALFAAARRRAGWSNNRISLHLAWRGLILIALQFLLENPAWSIPDTGVLSFSGYFGVLYGLGAAMFVWSMFPRLPTSLIAALSLACIGSTQLLVPILAPGGRVDSLWLGMFLAPGPAGGAYVLYPLVPWFGVAGLGICLGRGLARDPGRAAGLLPGAGIGALAVFVTGRLAGIGDFHPWPDLDWITLLSVTKYPPSLDYLLLTLGVDALVLGLFLRLGPRAGWLGSKLAVFGRAPLFFYLAHLYMFAGIGLTLGRPTTLAGMYPFWLLGLVMLYPACLAYGLFKAGRGPSSLWRLF